MIHLSQTSNPEAFTSTHYIVTQTPDGFWHWTLTGIVILSIKGTGSTWSYETVKLYLTLPGTGSKWVRLQQWAPFLTLNSIANKDNAVNAGWAVDTFGVDNPHTLAPSITVNCKIAVRDIDGYVYRLGYVVHAVGKLETPPPIE